MAAVPELPSLTEHGQRFVATLELPAVPDVVWGVLSAVHEWPAWNPWIEWTGDEVAIDDATREAEISLLSAGTLFRAHLALSPRDHCMQMRFVHPEAPQPPAFDISMRLAPFRSGSTMALADAFVEHWYLERLSRILPSMAMNPPLGVLRALHRALDRPRLAWLLAAARYGAA